MTGQPTDLERAKGIIAQVSGRDAAAIAPEMDLAVDLGLDSPKALELLVAIEDAFAVEISDEEAARLTTVGDIIDFVAHRT